MSEICRICLEKCTDLNQQIRNYIDVIEKVCQIKIIIDSSLPQMICETCLNGLLEADLFRDMCIKSHEVCLKAMNKDYTKCIDSVADEAYVTETCDFEPEIITRARCCICTEMFDSMQLLKNHCLLKYSIELYESEQNNQCAVCGIQYKSMENLLKHISIFEGSDTPQQPLTTLENTTVEIRFPKYRRNKNTFRGTYKPGITYKCHICNKNIRGYVSHLKTEHPNHPIEFKCHICSRTYCIMNSLISHMHNVHCNPHKFKCDMCCKVFARNVLMKQHREAVHFNIKKFECDFCHLKFARKQHLAVHAQTHVRKRSLRCKVCKREFNRQIELNNHLFKHVFAELPQLETT